MVVLFSASITTPPVGLLMRWRPAFPMKQSVYTLERDEAAYTKKAIVSVLSEKR